MQATPRSRLEISSAVRHPGRVCGVCANGCLSRVSRVSFTDYLLSEVGLFPYVCNACRCRTLRADFGRVAFLSVCIVVMLGMAGYTLRVRHRYHPLAPAVQSAPSTLENSDDILSNEDIAGMGRVNIPSAVIERLIAGRPHHFRIDADSLIALKKDGVPDDVILAMVTVTLERPNTRQDAGRGGSVIAAGP